MTSGTERFLAELHRMLWAQGCSGRRCRRVISELRAHLEDLQEQEGLDEAAALERLGAAELLARSFEPSPDALLPRLRQLMRALGLKLRREDMKRRLAIAAFAALLIGLLTGLWVSESAGIRDLQARIDRSEAELKRQEFVLQRDRKLRERCRDLSPEDRFALCEALPAASGEPMVASSPPSWFPLLRRARTHELRAELAGLQGRIARGSAVEARLPLIERRIATLESR